MRVQMRTTLAWAGEVDTEQLRKMIYDIVPIIEDWLVIAVKRGFYLLDVSCILVIDFDPS